MGILSSIVKGVSRAGQILRDLPGRLNRWDLSRDIKKEIKKAEKRAEKVSPGINAEIAALRRQTEELQRQNDMLIRAIEAGGKYGNAKASNDINKLNRQQKVADAIDAERDKAGAVEGSPEWDEARQRALDKIRLGHLEGEWKDPSDPDTNMTIDLTPEEQAALRYFEENPDSPWYYPE